VSGVARRLRRLAEVAGVDILLDESLHPREVVVLRNKFAGSGDTVVS
jgi:hypothetical protein